METQENLLEEIDLEGQMVEATRGQRFANLLLDMIGMYIFSFVIGLIFTIPIILISQHNHEFIRRGWYQIYLFVSGFVVCPLLYYTLLERITNGRTLGKIITKTRAVKYNGGRLTFKDAFLRSIIRFIPLEPISIWFNEAFWHDQWSKTKVIRVD